MPSSATAFYSDDESDYEDDDSLVENEDTRGYDSPGEGQENSAGSDDRQRTASSTPHQECTRKLKVNLKASGDIAECVVRVLEFMDSEDINLPLFLWALSWNPAIPELISNGKARYARTSLMVSEELPMILRHWYRPPRTHGTGVRIKAGGAVFQEFALEIVNERVQSDMRTEASDALASGRAV
ncbi:hypothetical protein SCP_0800470 [Sparassis crispa]|uniref:Uncharacterized protein n=1 Tax=Sparassis crispa TaxID=139825 RepID=A0A401GTL4_9APHY|nr:hypothetical protein SCP_0800470 [Sparassis crispa]GBE85530.1 hypothetical protein SCP_0800470 [Sparassis crispa]